LATIFNLAAILIKLCKSHLWDTRRLLAQHSHVAHSVCSNSTSNLFQCPASMWLVNSVFVLEPWLFSDYLGHVSAHNNTRSKTQTRIKSSSSTQEYLL